MDFVIMSFVYWDLNLRYEIGEKRCLFKNDSDLEDNMKKCISDYSKDCFGVEDLGEINLNLIDEFVISHRMVCLDNPIDLGKHLEVTTEYIETFDLLG